MTKAANIAAAGASLSADANGNVTLAGTTTVSNLTVSTTANAPTVRIGNLQATNGNGNISIPTGSKIIGVDVGSISAPGTILQVLQGINTSAVTISAGTTYTITTVSITPRSATSKFLLMSHVSGYQTYDTALFFTRNDTPIGVGDAAGNRYRGFGELGGAQRSNEQGVGVGFFLDSPATTSAITYALKIYNQSATAYINRSAADDNQSYDSRSTSTITVMEIAQ